MTGQGRRRAYAQVDVFGQDTTTGNPVGVVLDADDLDVASMRRFSAWTNLSECTFVLTSSTPQADYGVRIFNLTTEIPFAGHPTLGTARAWLEAGNTPTRPGVIIQECAGGLIPVRIDGDLLHFTSPARIRSGSVDAAHLVSITAILGLQPEQVLAAEWLDNGPGWVGVLLADAETVLRVRPDAAAFPGRWLIGVLGLYPPGSQSALEVRAFFTEVGTTLREDPVTGSLNAAAAEWLIGSGQLQSPYVASQGGVLGRRGRVYISSSKNRIHVGGHARATITGTVQL